MVVVVDVDAAIVVDALDAVGVVVIRRTEPVVCPSAHVDALRGGVARRIGLSCRAGRETVGTVGDLAVR